MVIKAVIVTVTLTQISFKQSQLGEYCMETSELLEHESDWITALISMQLFKVVFFTLWQLQLKDSQDAEESPGNDLFFGKHNTSSIIKFPTESKPHVYGRYCSMGVSLKDDNESEDEELLDKEDNDYFFSVTDEDVYRYEVVDTEN